MRIPLTMLEKAATSENQLSKEDYLILRAKEALATDIYAAKSWLITAKSLFPHSAKVQVNFYPFSCQNRIFII